MKGRGIGSAVVLAVAIIVTMVGVARATVSADDGSDTASTLWALIAAAGSLATLITFILRLARREVRSEVASLRLEIAALQRQLLDAFSRCSCVLPPRPLVDDEEDES